MSRSGSRGVQSSFGIGVIVELVVVSKLPNGNLMANQWGPLGDEPLVVLDCLDAGRVHVVRVQIGGGRRRMSEATPEL